MKDEVAKRTINRGIRNWLIDCPRYYFDRTAGRLIKHRNNKLWIFSTWEGTKYADNSRYLFEYVTKECPSIRCVWITKNKDVYDKLKEKNVDVCLSYTKEGEEIQKQAGVAIFTHGLDDFGNHPLMFGANTACLWHGIVGMKQALALRSLHDNVILDKIAVLKSRIFSYTFSDLMIATSDYDKDILIAQLLANKNVSIIGLPRNDVFANDSYGIDDAINQEIVKNYKIDKASSIITYMPTYRGSKDGQRRLEDIIRRLINDEGFNNYLEHNNIKFLMKMHYLTDVSGMQFTNNVILLDDADVLCTQQLLNISDVLITDYSSCSADFAITGKQIIYFTPDLEEYDVENGLAPRFKEILNNYSITTLEQLFDEIKKGASPKSIQLSDDLNNLFNKNKDKCGQYCKETTSEIINMFNIK